MILNFDIRSLCYTSLLTPCNVDLDILLLMATSSFLHNECHYWYLITKQLKWVVIICFALAHQSTVLALIQVTCQIFYFSWHENTTNNGKAWRWSAASSMILSCLCYDLMHCQCHSTSWPFIKKSLSLLKTDTFLFFSYIGFVILNVTAPQNIKRVICYIYRIDMSSVICMSSSLCCRCCLQGYSCK